MEKISGGGKYFFIVDVRTAAAVVIEAVFVMCFGRKEGGCESKGRGQRTTGGGEAKGKRRKEWCGKGEREKREKRERREKEITKRLLGPPLELKKGSRGCREKP